MCAMHRLCFYPAEKQATCPICQQPVSLERCKTDENGRAIHEDCYVAAACLGRSWDHYWRAHRIRR